MDASIMPQGGLPVAPPISAPSGLQQMQQMLQMQQAQYKQQQEAVQRIRTIQTKRDSLVDDQIKATSEAMDRAYPGGSRDILSGITAGIRGAGAYPFNKTGLGTVMGAITGLDYMNRDADTQDRRRALMQAKQVESAGNTRLKNIDEDIKSETDIMKVSKLAGSLRGGGAGSMDHSVLTGSQISSIYQMFVKKFTDARVDGDIPALAMEATKKAVGELNGGTPIQPPVIASGTGVQQQVAGAPTQPAPKAEPPSMLKPDPVKQAGDTEASKSLNKASMEDYEKNFRQPASAADNILSSVETIKTLGPVTGTAAEQLNWLGNAMATVGLDNSMVANAKNLSEAKKILMKLSNDRIRQEVGVQTASDEARFKAELAQITDPKEVFEMTMRYMKEAALRAKDKAAFAEWFMSNATTGNDPQGNAHANPSGRFNVNSLNSAWSNIQKQTQGPMIINIGGKPVFKHQYIESFIKKYGEDTGSEAEQMWVKKSKEGSR